MKTGLLVLIARCPKCRRKFRGLFIGERRCNELMKRALDRINRYCDVLAACALNLLEEVL
jgi:hypothetical protein